MKQSLLLSVASGAFFASPMHGARWFFLGGWLDTQPVGLGWYGVAPLVRLKMPDHSALSPTFKICVSGRRVAAFSKVTRGKRAD